MAPREDKIGTVQRDAVAIIDMHVAKLRSNLHKEIGDRECQLQSMIDALRRENRELCARLHLPAPRYNSPRPPLVTDSYASQRLRCQHSNSQQRWLSDSARGLPRQDREGAFIMQARGAHHLVSDPFALPDMLRKIADEHDQALATLADERCARPACAELVRNVAPEQIAYPSLEHPATPSAAGLLVATSTAVQAAQPPPQTETQEVQQTGTGAPQDERGRPAEEAPAMELHKFEMWSQWQDYAKTNTSADLALNRLTVKSEGGQSETVPAMMNIVESTFNASPKCLISTGSAFYLIWNMLFVATLWYELVLLPMQVFPMPVSTVQMALSWYAATFWTMDVLFAFITPYQDKSGNTVIDKKKIFRRYARSWLVPDVAMVAMDWLNLLSSELNSNSVGFIRFGKILRTLRVFRALRLVRLGKLKRAMNEIDNRMGSKYYLVIKSIILDMIVILIISHFLGCFWYFLGKQQVTGYRSWVEYGGYEGADWRYLYLTSLHWALTQITPGSMNVQAHNITERVFAVMVLVLGLIVFSSIVSSITQATTSLRSMNSKYSKYTWVLRKYFKQQDISADLVGRVMRYADNVLQPKLDKVTFHDVELLKMLPESLCREVNMEVYENSLSVHPFFEVFFSMSRNVMQKVCHSLQQVVLAQGDELFGPGQTAHAMYFVSTGRLLYSMEHLDVEMKEVTMGQWFC